MVFFEWKEQYELGLPHIDLQHTMIVNMVNELYMSLAGLGLFYAGRLLEPKG